MNFIQTAAPTGLRTREVLSADNGIPERHIVVAALRDAAPVLGLSATVIATLDAMLSCLAPHRNHHTVFASNATLTFRRNGISDRSIRRHAEILQNIGLLVRRDSPNGKRFTKRNRHDGTILRFGFDLSPLFERLHEIARIADGVIKEREQIDYLRCKIRAAANHSLRTNPEDETALRTLRLLRRKLSLTDCEHLLEQQSDAIQEAESADTPTGQSATIMSSSAGHFVRHHHKSNIENIDREIAPSDNQPVPPDMDDPITIAELLEACPEAVQLSPRSINTVHDVVTHAQALAPMLGINTQTYDAAQKHLGPVGAAITVWAITQLHRKIRTVGAYFRSITTGAKSKDFSPEKLVRRLARSHCHPS